MIRMKRRKRIEGWAEDVSDLNNNGNNSGLRQRLADNNKLWLLSLVVVISLSIYFVRDVNRSSDGVNNAHLPVADFDSYDPAEYDDYALSLAKKPDYQDIVCEPPSFNGPDRFRLVVLGDASRDDIEYLARMTAMSISHKFKHRVTVQVYMKRASGSKSLIAHTAWTAKKGYSVKFKDSADDLLQ